MAPIAKYGMDVYLSLGPKATDEEVGELAGFWTRDTRADTQRASRDRGRALDGVFEGDAGGGHRVKNPLDQWNGASCQQVRTRESNDAVALQGHGYAGEIILSRFQSGEVNGIGRQYDALSTFRVDDGTEHGRGHVVKIGDNGTRQPVIGELWPKWIVVPVEQRGDPVAEMGHHRSAGIGRARNLLGGGIVMPKRYDNTLANDVFYERNCTGLFRGEGCVGDAAVGGV